MKGGPKCWIYTEKCNGLERNLNGLEGTMCVPVLTILPVFLTKIGVMVLKEIKILPFFAMCQLYQAKMAEFAGD